MQMEAFFGLVPEPRSAEGSVPVDFSGMWKNQHRSDMELLVDAAGKVAGIYRTGVGQPTPAEEFDLMGFASGDQISFTVDFGRYGSLTAWVGQHTRENEVEKIYTMWLLSKNVPDEEEKQKLWGTLLTGSDIFERVT